MIKQHSNVNVRRVFIQPRAFSVVILGCTIIAFFIYSQPRYAAAKRIDRVARLLELLDQDDNVKVRLQVIIGLGKSGDSRAVAPLEGLLSDDNASVRGLAAAALGKIGDKAALAALQQLARTERSSFVQHKLSEAVDSLAASSGSHAMPSSRVEMVVAPGAFHHTGAASSRASLTHRFREKLLDAMHQSPRVHATKTRAQATKLGQRKHNAFVLDGTIEGVTKRSVSDGVIVKCNVRISLATLPKNSIKAIYTGSASTIIPASEARSGVSDSTYDSLLGSVSESARAYFLQSAVVMAR